MGLQHGQDHNKSYQQVPVDCRRKLGVSRMSSKIANKLALVHRIEPRASQCVSRLINRCPQLTRSEPIPKAIPVPFEIPLWNPRR